MPSFKESERYVITGMGLASPIGNDPETAWQALLNNQHGVENVRNTLFKDYESLPIYVAAPVKDFNLGNDSAFTGNYREIRAKWDLGQQFILWAGAQALRMSGLSSAENVKVEEHGLDPYRFGVYVGTGVGGANVLGDARALLEKEKERYLQALLDGDKELASSLIGETRINPKWILKALPGRVAATPSMIFGAKAFWDGVLRECASGNGAIISAVEAIKLGKADVVLAGGVEGDITPSTIGLFGAAGAVSKNQDADSASRPFDKARDGLVMGQGAGAVVVERMDHALNRDAPILAEIVGYAENADAMNETEPDPINVLRCIRDAISTTGERRLRNVSAQPHATSTLIGDPAELDAITRAFKPEQLVGITATKAATGHMLGAAGAAEAVFSILSLRDGKTPPIHNLDDPIDGVKGYEHLMSNDAPIPADIEYVVNNSFGFGGNNAVTIFARPR